MKVLVTGSAGFIGAHLCATLSSSDYHVVGVDNYNEYYDPSLKRARNSLLARESTRHEISLVNSGAMLELFDTEQPDVVVHLAAQAGVRYSFDAPMAYADSNLTGQVSLLEAVRKTASVKRLIYASSSSVYSGLDTLPFQEDMQLGTPKSLYAASKVAGEVLAATYSRLFDVDAIGLRFFTVYGPWGRPDMAYWLFANALQKEEEIRLFNHGDVRRDFTYVDDITAAIVRMVDEVARDAVTRPMHRVYNIGNNSPEPVLKMVNVLEQLLGKKANIRLEDLPPGDMVETYADIEKLKQAYSFSPDTPLEDGLEKFVRWYIDWNHGE